ncbi:2'-5' RNA ligase family protein [Dawidia soli]|uniref:2'-5' RNA ligase family protein n=1 Tax=Dawidia soli TaxID=2782352 RepID=A0AAP2D791_9BACT|nr:2'-5' RNA ligase family protein [Dawidia soli]MBT1685305.1 2'-5' RNA ligase family protein [Dawidia soli]
MERLERQYFIAIIPPPPVSDDALRLKHYFRDQYNSKASLNSPPHITLHMPFKWKEEKEGDLIEALEQFATGREALKIELINFNAFPPRVIFIEVEANPLLHALNKDLHRFCKRSLNLFNADYKDQPFHPHLTLAFRDLKKPMFAKAWEEFQQRTFTARFHVGGFFLLKHSGKIWEPFREFLFDPTASAGDERPGPIELHQ